MSLQLYDLSCPIWHSSTETPESGIPLFIKLPDSSVTSVVRTCATEHSAKDKQLFFLTENNVGIVGRFRWVYRTHVE